MSRQHLQSAQQNTLVVPRYRLTTYGRPAFSVAGLTAWNCLPVAFRDPTISDACFRRHLKTVLFAQQRRHHSVKRVRDLFMTTRCINSRSFIHPGVSPPENILRFLMPNPAFGGQFGSENKLIEGQPNEHDVICWNASVLAFHLWPTIFARAPFRLQNIYLNGVPPRSRTTTPLAVGPAARRVLRGRAQQRMPAVSRCQLT